MRSRLFTFIRERFRGPGHRRAALIALAAIVLLGVGGGVAALVILGGGGGPAGSPTTTPSSGWQRLELASESFETPFEMTAEEADDIGVDPDTRVRPH